jgi:nitroreductase
VPRGTIDAGCRATNPELLMTRNADLTEAVEHALRAPSVHNTQPWRWRIVGDEVELYADWTRHLPWTDPERRDLMISCGAALHHLRVALAAQNLRSEVDRLSDTENEGHLATIRVQGPGGDAHLAAMFGAVRARRTERRRMSHQPVPASAVTKLVHAAAREDTQLLRVSGERMRRELAAALSAAAHEQAAAPGYAGELQLWTRRTAGSRDGVPARNVAVAPPGLAGPSPLRQFPHAELPQPRHPAGTGAPDDAAELLVLASGHDNRQAWLRAGEALSAVLLTATSMGLVTTPLSQPVEMPASRNELRKHILQVPEHPQLLLRVGWPVPGAAELPETARRGLHSVLLHS